MTTQVVLITGALSGIGRATALAFAKEGRVRLVISGRREEDGNKLVAEIRKSDVEALFVRCDVRNEDEVRALVDQTVARFGRLDAAGHIGAAGASIYVASKHAVEGLTKSAALEAAASGVRINAVAPGPIETAMLDRFTGTEERKAALLATVPLGRAGSPEEVAQLIVFLSSEKASYMTGPSYLIDGGKLAV